MSWVIDNFDVLVDALGQHLVLSLPPIVLTALICVPICWIATRRRRVGGVLVTASALLYTIPSLPLFLILPAILGTGRRSPINVIIALTLYGIAILVPVTVSALRGIPRQVRDASIAMGHSRTNMFFEVELPVAGPSILSGLRVVAASTISLATLGSVLGVAGLGSLFIDGFKRGIQAEIISGLVLTVGLALVVDLALVLIGRAAMPWTRVTAAPRRWPATKRVTA